MNKELYGTDLDFKKLGQLRAELKKELNLTNAELCRSNKAKSIFFQRARQLTVLNRYWIERVFYGN